TKTATVTLPASEATATITVTQSVAGMQISSITIGGVNISGSITADNNSTSALATKIAAAITSRVSSPEYTASASGSTVTITSVATGSSQNGRPLVVNATQVGTGAATATIRVGSGNGNSANYVN